MPKSKKSSKSTTRKPISNIPAPMKFDSENLKLLAGLLLVVVGLFLIIAIMSYFNTWKQDQSGLQSSESFTNYLFHYSGKVANSASKLGAAAAHVLVFKGIGIMALVFASWLAALGINRLYGKQVIPTRKWIRWMALGFLFLCPFLSLVFASSEFSYGGSLGNVLIGWSNAVAGLPGTIAMLVLVFSFFALMVFQWDIKPWLQRARKMIPKMPEFQTKTAESPSGVAPVSGSGHLSDDIEEASKNPFGQNYYEEQEGSSTLQVDASLIEDEDDMGMELIDIEEGKEQRPTTADASIPGQERHVEDSAQVRTEAVEELPTSLQDKNGITIEIPIDPATADTTDTPDPATEQPVLAKTTSTAPEATSVSDMLVIAGKEEDSVHLEGNRPLVASSKDKDLPNYRYPILDLLEDKHMENIALNAEELAKNKEQIINTLRSFGIEISKIQATVGPTVTLYEIVPQEGVRISKIRNLEDDIALNLAALGIRMIAPIPGRGTIGIEVPNEKKQVVPMRALLSSEKFINNEMSLPIALGKKIDNENYIVDLATMPHLLMAGATGQGKSVGINAILVSLLYKKHPSELKLVLVDPKKVELSVYRLIEKHYLAKLPNEEEAIITDTKKVINTLNSLCIEMDNRYELLKDAGARNIKEYNEKFKKGLLRSDDGHKFLPFIVLVVDEFADLIMTAGKEIEMPVARLAQLARAVGIHLIVATQRPSVNVITGIIKANFPARIAFRVTSKVDSRTILDTGGADQLIGRGDMLVSHGSELLRIQCAFVDTPEVERIVAYIGTQQGYPSAFELPEYEGAEDEQAEKKDVDLTKRDKMFEECARLVVNSQSGSTSMLQRKFNLGYNRAGRIMDQLEAAGIVGAQSGSKPRDVLVTSEYELERILETLG